jgi:hypothetical protein
VVSAMAGDVSTVSTGRMKPLVREIVVAAKSVSSGRRAVPGGEWSHRSFLRCQERRREPAARRDHHAPSGMEFLPAGLELVGLLRTVADWEGECFHNGIATIGNLFRMRMQWVAQGYNGVAWIARGTAARSSRRQLR